MSNKDLFYFCLENATEDFDGPDCTTYWTFSKTKQGKFATIAFEYDQKEFDKLNDSSEFDDWENPVKITLNWMDDNYEICEGVIIPDRYTQ